MALEEEISRYSSVESVVWLLPLGGIYNEEKQAEQRNTVYSLRRKRTQENAMELSVLKEMKGLNQSLILNGIREW